MIRQFESERVSNPVKVDARNATSSNIRYNRFPFRKNLLVQYGFLLMERFAICGAYNDFFVKVFFECHKRGGFSNQMIFPKNQFPKPIDFTSAPKFSLETDYFFR